MKPFEIVFSHNQGKVILFRRVALMQVNQGVYRIIRLRQVKLNFTRLDFRIILNHLIHHLIAMVICQQRFLSFEGALGRNYKPNLIQWRKLCHMVCYGQMPNMNGIEGAEKQTNFLHDATSRFDFRIDSYEFGDELMRFFQGDFQIVVLNDFIKLWRGCQLYRSFSHPHVDFIVTLGTSLF